MDNPQFLFDNTLNGKTIICFSHLRWGFVYQRPQHLMSRFAMKNKVVFIEEAVFDESVTAPEMRTYICPQSGVNVMTPHLPISFQSRGFKPKTLRDKLQNLIQNVLTKVDVKNRIFWFYTPMMIDLIQNQKAAAIIYDCMDELANFQNAPIQLQFLEKKLLSDADIVFTGGQALYESKLKVHSNVHMFPSGIEFDHFCAARNQIEQPADQIAIPHPRLGFFGVIDERMDLKTLDQLAKDRPDYSIVMIDPVVKISVEDLPKAPNIYYLGMKQYKELPAYLSGWDAALMNFAINDATKYISPTKTPEYLAGGKPVICTPILDVIRGYGDLDAVFIAENGDDFVEACDNALDMANKSSDWMIASDERIATQSWDIIQAKMASIIKGLVQKSVFLPAVRISGRNKPIDVMIVGAGPAGCVMAERLASQSDKKVLLVDRRPHIGGNTFDHYNEHGILVHKYGPHIFHTNSADIFNYLSRFTGWRSYEHRVLADVSGQLVPIPINRTTLNLLYNAGLKTDMDAENFLSLRAEKIDKIVSSEDVVVSKVGRELYNSFFKYYSLKQWDLDPADLDKSVTARVPTRTNTDDRYFTDQYQAMPLHGYTKLFERMTNHPNIRIETSVDYHDVRDDIDCEHIVYTGPIDEYFDYKYGKLPYRSLKFKHETLNQEWVQSVGTVNYPGADVPYTRRTEYKHITGQIHKSTSVTYEYGSATGDPYYPILTDQNQAIYKKYEALAKQTRNVTFVGRLATYRYYNMDQVIGQSLAAHRRMEPQSKALLSQPMMTV